MVKLWCIHAKKYYSAIKMDEKVEGSEGILLSGGACLIEPMLGDSVGLTSSKGRDCGDRNGAGRCAGWVQL